MLGLFQNFDLLCIVKHRPRQLSFEKLHCFMLRVTDMSLNIVLIIRRLMACLDVWWKHIFIRYIANIKLVGMFTIYHDVDTKCENMANPYMDYISY